MNSVVTFLEVLKTSSELHLRFPGTVLSPEKHPSHVKYNFRSYALKCEHTDVSQHLSYIHKARNAEVGRRGERPRKGQRKHKPGHERYYKIF